MYVTTVISPFSDVVLFSQNSVASDERGSFVELYREVEFECVIPKIKFVQENVSESHGGVFRGLHYQNPHPQGKLVRVLCGSVLDIFVDLRESSPTFGMAGSVFLSSINKCLWIPPGFAHGFYVPRETTKFSYKLTDYYKPEAEHCLLWNDPLLSSVRKILKDWNIVEPTVSYKDTHGKTWNDCEKFA